VSRLILRKGVGLAIVRIPPLLTAINVAGEEHAPRMELVAGGKLQRRARGGPDRVATVACRGPSLDPANQHSSVLSLSRACLGKMIVLK
jgi:hypothetical protein